MAKNNAADTDPIPVQKLGEFEGEDVVALRIVLKNAGDGLSKAVSVSPQIIHRGDKVYVVFETEASKISFKGIKDTSTLERVVDLVAESATIVDEKLVRDALDETTKAIEEKAGVRRLQFGSTDPDGPDEETG